jgi:hypothetical protein
VLLFPASASAASVVLSFDGAGHLSAQLQVTAQNGSALREAMDGSFGPLVDLISTNASQRASILAQISAAESTPFVSAYFGNRDGTVSASEVSLFETLLQQESQLLPSSSFTSSPALAVTLDGAAPTSITLTGVSFQDATGPADSTAPVIVAPSVALDFPFSGSSHVLALSANITAVGFTLSPVLGNVNLTLSLPNGQAVTQSAGFSNAQIQNDLLGWGPSSFSGTYAPSTHGEISVSFGAAFPAGDVLVVALAAAVGIVLALLWLRRRRRPTGLPPTPPAA